MRLHLETRLVIKPTTPPGHVNCSLMAPSLTWKQWDMPHIAPIEFRSWALAHHLYSRGSDFSSGNTDFRNPGRSALRRLWDGEPSDPHDALSVWAIDHEGMGPIGVVSWEQLNENKAPTSCIGRVSLWMHPQMRRRGLMGCLMEEAVLPRIEIAAKDRAGLGVVPYIRASDAAVGVIRSRSKIVVSPYFSEMSEPSTEKWLENAAPEKPASPRIKWGRHP